MSTERQGPTPRQMKILQAAAEIEEQLQWLREHPGKTQRDYHRGLKDYPNGEVFKWRIAKAKAADKAERKAWLRDHPGRPLPEHLCSLTQAEGATVLAAMSAPSADPNRTRASDDVQP